MHIAIAGNIGSGKTTLAKLLSNHYGWEAQYDNPELNPYLVDFYNNMREWSFNLQVYFLSTRYETVLNIRKKSESVIQDRTVYEDACIFAPSLFGMGLMTERDFETYKSLYNLLMGLIPPPDLMIYLKASVPTLVRQIQKRGREYETSIRIDYLQSLNDKYDSWIETYNGKSLTVNVDILNFSENADDLQTIINKIEKLNYEKLNYEL